MNLYLESSAALRDLLGGEQCAEIRRLLVGADLVATSQCTLAEVGRVFARLRVLEPDVAAVAAAREAQFQGDSDLWVMQTCRRCHLESLLTALPRRAGADPRRHTPGHCGTAGGGDRSHGRSLDGQPGPRQRAGAGVRGGAGIGTHGHAAGSHGARACASTRVLWPQTDLALHAAAQQITGRRTARRD